MNVPDLHVVLYGAAGAGGIGTIWFSWQRFLRFLESHHVADWGSPWLNRLDGLNRLMCKRFHRLEHEPLHMPASGGVLVAANHVSGLDPLLMIAASSRPLRFLIAREQYERWWLKWLFKGIGCIPIGRRGGHRSALVAAKAALEAGEVVALFPEGRIHGDSDLPRQLKPGIMLVAQETGVPVCPLRLEGVRGKGQVLGALFHRSRARISQFGLLYCEPGDPDRFLDTLGRLLFGK